MSRASGAGAYSHGIAWPSPIPQLEGEVDGLVGAGTFDVTGTRVSLAMRGIIRARHRTARR